MSELPTHFVAQKPADLESSPEDLLNPELVKARLYVQTIQRFQELNNEILEISNLQYGEARTKLDTLALKEYGKVWEVLKRPDVEVFQMTIGGKTKDELKSALLANGYKMYDDTEQMLENPDFVTLSNPVPVVLVRLPGTDLGFPTFASTEEIFAKAQELGLELCPAEVGPWYRLHTSSQPMNEGTYVGMKPITDAEGIPNVFGVRHGDRFLRSNYAAPDGGWISRNRFLFRLPLLRSAPTEFSND